MSLRLLTTLALWSAASVAADDSLMAPKHDDVFCLTLHEDLVRRQTDEWGSTGPFTIEDGTKHTPFVAFNAETRKATVIVGNGDDVGGVYHPMVASDNPTTVHFVTHIYAVDQHGVIFATETMDPNMPAPASVMFDVPEQVTEMTAYEFCNLHGLWMGPTVSTAMAELGFDNNSTNVEKAGEDAEPLFCYIDSPLSVAFDSFAADFVRRQSLPPFNSLDPYDEDDGTKHTPYVRLNDNGTATVTVGVEGNYHVMKGAAWELDENGETVEPHWITEVYVVDQTGEILSMQSLNPTHLDIAQITFDIPSSATTLTAYEWCNIHGLYIGPTIDVITGEIITSNTGAEEEEMAGLASGAESQQKIITVAAGVMVTALLL